VSIDRDQHRLSIIGQHRLSELTLAKDYCFASQFWTQSMQKQAKSSQRQQHNPYSGANPPYLRSSSPQKTDRFTMQIVSGRRTVGAPVKCTEELRLSSFAFLRSTNRDFLDLSIFIHSTPVCTESPSSFRLDADTAFACSLF
jgi:hypothetical protein